MKLLISMMILGVFTSCASRPFKAESEENDKMMSHLSQGVKYSNGEFPDRFNDNGIRDGYVWGVGKSIYPIEKGVQVAEEAAKSNAKFDLINMAPTMMESLVKKIISSESGEFQDFSKEDISITKIKNLTGIQVSAKDTMCKTRTEPVTGPEKYKISRECRSVAKVRLSDMRAAFDFTLSDRLLAKVDKKKILRSME
ncbi:putative lipoprotein [Bacteriovorax sp. BSW11_IV]|uniref:hypothetical protein n=1 Tax=Bacteriovorax sp. BSW11_IV TaxID=1353529 RepID=UPI00038A37DC|nr:hypothetical protein [Bacteriovorax sp. BSW11_IV]EQC44487.1 putative lipoprotein [Bacteriovorax sp. BSW11_IV]